MMKIYDINWLFLYVKIQRFQCILTFTFGKIILQMVVIIYTFKNRSRNLTCLLNFCSWVRFWCYCNWDVMFADVKCNVCRCELCFIIRVFFFLSIMNNKILYTIMSLSSAFYPLKILYILFSKGNVPW